MENKYITIKSDFTIKNGEIKDLVLRFSGNLNKFIVDYINDPTDSNMHKDIIHTLQNVIRHPVSIKEVDNGN